MGALKLLVLSGPDAGCEYAIDQGSLVVGRSSSCDAVLRDGSVSRRHFEVRPEGQGVLLVDLGSSNGTFLDGRRVERAPLTPGAIVAVGASEFTLVEEPDGGRGSDAGPAPTTTSMLALDTVGSMLGAGERARRELQLLYRAAKALQGEQDLASLGRRLLELAQGGLGATQGTVYLREGDSTFQEVAHVRTEGTAPLPEPQRAALTAVLESGKGALLNTSPGVALAVPLPAQGRTVGVAWLQAPDGVSWGDADLCLVAALGEIAGPAYANLLARVRLAGERGRLHRTLREACGIIGESAALHEVLELVPRLAAAATPVLVQGETGTGKELVARALHYGGPRAGGPLVSVNCASLPPDLVESELFGHERGAFTGADARRRGRIELAHGGTLFLDEVGELPLPAQAKLLRVVETMEVERVGGRGPVKVDVRLVAATNRNLAGEAAAGRFRQDLLYRINAVTVAIPPLRERRADLDPLLEHFLARSSREAGRARAPRFDEAALHHLRAYRWPGNVRELRNLVERCVVLAEGDLIGLADLPPEVVREAAAAEPAAEGDRPLSLQELEARHVAAVLRHTGGNKQQAAALLGIERATLYAKIKKYGLTADEA